MRRVLGISVLALLGLGALLGTTGAVRGATLGQTGYGETAAAPTPAGIGSTILVDADQVSSLGTPINPGQVLRFQAGGFGPDTDVTVLLASKETVLATTTADRGGVIDVDVEIPRNTPLGTHHLIAKGVDTHGKSHEDSVKIIIGKRSTSAGTSWTTVSLLVLLGLVVVAFAVIRRPWQRRERGVNEPEEVSGR